MYLGDLIHLKFEFWGDFIEAVLECIPTAKVIGYDGEKAIMKAKVYDRGIEMWFLSQWKFLGVLEPFPLWKETKVTLERMLENYR